MTSEKTFYIYFPKSTHVSVNLFVEQYSTDIDGPLHPDTPEKYNCDFSELMNDSVQVVTRIRTLALTKTRGHKKWHPSTPEKYN